MTDTKKQPDFDDAIAKDWCAGIERDLSAMSPGQLALTKKVLSEFKNKKSDTSQRDMERKIQRMTDKERDQFIRDCEYEQRSKNG